MRHAAGALLALCLALPLGGCRRPPSPAAARPGPRFEDVTTRAGIRFTHHTGAYGQYLMPESVGCGGAFLDYDDDGRQDLFLVNSSNWPGHPGPQATCALYHNEGGGAFKDVTAQSGLGVAMYGMGCAAGDYDGDGREDLLVTCLGPNHLFRNLGNGRFQDVTRGSGLDDSPRWAWHTSAAWVDTDRDGRLDLFVCRYVRWSPETDVRCGTASGGRTYCGPSQYSGDRSVLYRNLGGGKFRNVSAETGIAGGVGKGLGVLPLDENGDGWTDLFVTNDLVPNHLWRSVAGRRFREVAQEAGVAVAEGGNARAGMGVDGADIRNDGALAFAVGNFAGEGLGLFVRGPAVYSDECRSAGLVPASLSRLTFGLFFADVDRDGWQDLFTYNGHVDPHAGENGEAIQFRQPPQLFRNESGRFVDVTGAAGPALQVPQVGRGCAWGDFDDDGRPDILLCENAGPARLLRNVTPDAHHWLGIRLRGRGGNRDGYGAEVRLTAGGVTQRRWVRRGGSYLSQSDPRALFGLGAQAGADRLEVKWPSGRTTAVEHPPVDRYMEVPEPQ